jgi:Tc toxin complex TcA C-terminal TcB-binding domain/Neuraminidase-like domain/Salmonella virulence plasmid 28.1kDa A protein
MQATFKLLRQVGLDSSYLSEPAIEFTSWPAARASLVGKVPDELLPKLDFAVALSEHTGDRELPELADLRQFALKYNPTAMTELMTPPAGDAADTRPLMAKELRSQLFHLQPSAVLQRMVIDNELPIAEASVRAGVAKVLDTQPEFDIRKSSILEVLRKPDVFDGIDEAQRPAVAMHLKTMQRLSVLSPTPDAVAMLMKSNQTSAFQIGEMPQDEFVRTMSATMGEATARMVHTNAMASRVQNEHTLMHLRQLTRGTGLAAIDGSMPRAERMNTLMMAVKGQTLPVNLESLFGSVDTCECKKCLSVYSPAAYFVELLQYLRNNNLQQSQVGSATDITGTPLDMLFRRRPDLGCLELTCENTYTVLPYIDLVNEVLESFIVHRKAYETDPNSPKKTTLEAFNVEDETSSELLAEPQHINDKAYCVLKDAVYPFTLPYHQPIDAIRIYLEYLGTSREELIDTFRSANDPCFDATVPALQAELNELHTHAIDRAVDAESLGLTEEEYVILVRQKFWTKRYFEIVQKKTISDDEYRTLANIRPIHKYYGLEATDPLHGTLTQVKAEFLPRTGLQYKELVDLLKTRFINPNYPTGEALEYLLSIRASYQLLMTFAVNSEDVEVKYGKLVRGLQEGSILWPKTENRLHPNPCKPAADPCSTQPDIRKWVQCWFEKIGKLIVLESGDGARLSIEGVIFQVRDVGGANTVYGNNFGYLNRDGSIERYDPASQEPKPFGEVLPSSAVVGPDNKPFWESVGVNAIRYEIHDSNGKAIAYIFNNSILVGRDRQQPIAWLPADDSCDLSKVRLQHLDGTALDETEYDRIQVFIRLWRKLGWSIDEVDQAIVGLAPKPVPCGPAAECGGSCDDCGGDCTTTVCCGPDLAARVPKSLTPEFLHDLAAINKLLGRTGLELPKLLTLWDDISTAGQKPLYDRLFLTHNLVSIDPVFKRNRNGNVLTGNTKVADHLPVLQAALRLQPADVNALSLPAELTLATVSAAYRRVVFAKLLGIRVADLAKALKFLGDPFAKPTAALAALARWERIRDAGFTLPQMLFLLNHDPDSPLIPTARTVLQLGKTLYDGLTAITLAHPDILSQDQATPELAQAKVGLLFEPTIAAGVLALLDGTTVYTTNAPPGLTIEIPDVISGTSDPEPLKTRLKYTKAATTATVQVTGILDGDEVLRAKNLSSSAQWKAAIDRLVKQKKNLFKDYLADLFDTEDEKNPEKSALLAGDHAESAPAKRFLLLKALMPKLRKALGQRLIIDTLSGMTSLPKDIAGLLLTRVLKAGTPEVFAMELLEKLGDARPASLGWTGYLIAPADGDYHFSTIKATAPSPLVIDGEPVLLSKQQEDPNDVWFTDPDKPVNLVGGRLYTFTVTDQQPTEIFWRTATAPKSAIPTSALLPNMDSADTTEILVKLKQSALVVNGFNLNKDEVNYWQDNGLEFNAVTIEAWDRVCSYATLRDALPKRELTLLDLFAWAKKSPAKSDLVDWIVKVTDWPKDPVTQLLEKKHFDLLDPAKFTDERVLVRLAHALEVYGRIGLDVPSLFEWAVPTSKFKACRAIADAIRAAIRARYSADDYELAIKPSRDRLRKNQRNALVAFLLVEKALQEWGVTDADSLYEFFLIDVQMDCCLETSRIKQGISTVQLYVQRCMLGLEREDLGRGVNADKLDRNRWKWLSREVIRTANRKVFINPENYLVPSLRDDKSPPYKDLATYVHKVNEVANLKVVGLYAEGLTPTTLKILHVFGRSRNAPYLFYYRKYDNGEGTSATPGDWTAWEQMPVDIPTFEVKSADGQVQRIGSYLTPIVWNKRLLIFFPQLAPKTIAIPPENNDIKPKDGGYSMPAGKTKSCWEVRLAWSEYRNGKWAPKQVSIDPGYTVPVDKLEEVEFLVDRFIICPQLAITDDSAPILDVYYVKAPVVTYRFDGNTLAGAGKPAAPSPTELITFGYQPFLEIHSLQFETKELGALGLQPKFTDNTNDVQVAAKNSPSKFNSEHADDLVGNLALLGTDGLFSYLSQKIITTHPDNPFGQYQDEGVTSYHELKSPIALPMWELGLHSLMAIHKRLSTAGQLEEALRILQYVFNPTAKNTADDPIWRFPPFREVKADTSIADILAALQPNTPKDKITEWRDHPFEPHRIARGRPVAYMMWVVMTYIDTLIAAGDVYFRQNSLETVPIAIQYYVMASHLLGPRPQIIPKRGKTKVETYRSLLPKWDAFDNALVELELAMPFSNQTMSATESINGTIALPNVFGFATALYFCVPDNPKLKLLRDTIDDRLFKIRHCQDIDGIFRKLPLFDPPIDPMLFVEAVAGGQSLASVMNDASGAMPNYRFYYLLQKAQELCSELKSMGSAYLSAKEKRDGEALARLRAGHETAMQTLVMDIRKKQLDEANSSLEALVLSRKAPAQKMEYFLALTGDKTTQVPDGKAEFKPLANNIEAPVDDGGLKLSPNEKEEMDKAKEASEIQEDVGNIETLAAILHIIPDINIKATPFGVGVATTILHGLGNAAQATAKAISVKVGNRTFSSTNAGRKAGHQRTLQDRVQQATAAGFEIVNIDRQILTQRIRLELATQEINNQQKQIDNLKEVEDFLRNKYSNTELFEWMAGAVQGLYRQVYSLAFDLAKRAERVFRFERGLSESSYIKPGYWDDARDGLLAGERLHLALKQLELAYQEKRGHDFEVTRHVSLRQLDPFALLQLRSTGSCEFNVPETLFDMDYPGHYQRRIKSVAISVPCVVGPYTGLNATLRLLEHSFRTTSVVSANDYADPEKKQDHFTTTNIPVSAIAASSGQNDSGVFELNFRDERYLPFEGAGAISKWRIELPTQVKQFDYGTINDVVLHLRYTSLDGGNKLRGVVEKTLEKFVKGTVDLSRREGLFTIFDLRADFSNEWSKLVQSTAAAELPLSGLQGRMPYLARAGAKPKATQVYLFWRYTGTTVPVAPKLTVSASSTIDMKPSAIVPQNEKSKIFTVEVDDEINNDWKLSYVKPPQREDQVWVVVKYVL